MLTDEEFRLPRARSADGRAYEIRKGKAKGDKAMIKKTVLGLSIMFMVLSGVFMPDPASAGEALKWVGCGVSKKAFMSALATAYETKTGIKISLQGGGATRGIADVAEGKADMGGTCRHALLRSEERGVKLIPVGWDALVVLVHPSNTVRNLTLEQLRNIFTGKITNWQQVGGPDRKIVVVARPGKISGVGVVVRELVFKNPEQEFTPSARIEKDSTAVEQVVERESGAVAISGVSSAQKRKVKLVELNGKMPSHENIQDGAYLLYRPLYLVTKQQASPEVRSFVAFALSEEGQAVIAGEKTVNLKAGARLWGRYSQQMKEAGITPGMF